MNNESTDVLHNYIMIRFNENNKRFCHKWTLIIQKANDIVMTQRQMPTYAICGRILNIKN